MNVEIGKATRETDDFESIMTGGAATGRLVAASESGS